MINKTLVTTILILILLSSNLKSLSAMEKQSITVRVLVLNFDPLIPMKDNKPLHVVCGWNDPRQLAGEYLNDVKKVSDNYVNYKIVEWLDVNEFPVKTDGFKYTPESYMSCFEKKSKWHEPDGVDYEKLVVDYQVVDKINNNEIDELWIFGAPYFGYWESAMAGPGSFYINGGVYENVKSKRPFAIMGFNYERGVAEMLHDLSHRTEATMTRIYGGWEVDKLNSNWAKFAANAFQSNGIAAVGTCHYPPNGEKDYDYKNPRIVESNADDYLTYPFIKGEMKKVSCESWGGPDYHRNYMIWWFTRLPKAPGINDDGRLNNWWEYVFNFTSYNEDGSLKN